MKKPVKIITAAFITAILMHTLPCAVYAEGLAVSVDKESCELGEKITVSVDAESLGDGTAPADIQVEYNSNRLNFEGCSVDYGGGGGGLVTFKDKKATVDFTTLSGGAAEIKVTATADDAAAPEVATVSVQVAGEDTAAALDAATVSTTGVSAATIDIGDGRVIQTVFADEFMPVLFHKETTDYNGQTVECARFDMGDMTLLYTSDAAGADGRFMTFNASTSELGEFRMIQGIENRFIIVLPDCEGPIPDGYTKAVLEWDGQTLTAFMENSVAAGTAVAADGINPADFFLVYAMSSEGNKGWYRYDKNEGTYQRFLNTEGSAQSMTDEESGDDASSSSDILADYIPSNIRSILLLVLAPLALILLITVIILAVKVHDYGEDLDALYEEVYGDEEYEDEEDEEERESVRRAAKPGAVTAASLVGRSMSEETEEAEEDEEEDGEEDDGKAYRPQSAAEEDDGEEDEEDEEEDEEEDDQYDRPLTRKERRELAKEEKWRAKEEKKAAKRRLQGYEEATPMDWSTFEKDRTEDEDVKVFKKSKPPKYMTESMEPVEAAESEEEEIKPKKAPLPPRRKTVYTEEENQESPKVLREEDQREKQRRLFEQQQRIEEQRRIEKEQQEAKQLEEQQKFIASRNEDLDLDEDFQFEFLNLD